MVAIIRTRPIPLGQPIPKVNREKPEQALKEFLFGKGYRFFDRLPYLSSRVQKKALYLAVKPGLGSQVSAFILWKYRDDERLEMQFLEDPHSEPVEEDMEWIRTTLGIQEAKIPLNRNLRHRHKGPKRKRERWDSLVHARDYSEYKHLYPEG